MKYSLRRLTAAEQTAAHLREVIRAGRWTDKLPGVRVLAAECDVSTVTMRRALALLAAENRILPSGAGRCRKVVAGGEMGAPRRSLRVMVMLETQRDAVDVGFNSFLFRLQNELEGAGHTFGFAKRSQAELRNDVGRISRCVASTPADAWVVAGGTKETLTWFAGQEVPAIAIGGSYLGVDIASTGMSLMPAYQVAIRRLIALGHRGIVFLCPAFGRQPEPISTVRILSEELVACGVTTSHYNVPDWEETPAGIFAQLENSFRLTPPTAIITAYTNWTVAVLAFLARRGLQIPRDVSVFSMNYETWFNWHRPSIAHLYGDESQVARRIVRWVNAAARGQADRKEIRYPLRFVAGESIGPAPR